MMIHRDDFHQFRRSQDSRAGLDREGVLYNSQPIVPSPPIGAKQSSPPIDRRLLLSLVRFRDRDIPVNPLLGASSNHQAESRPQLTRDSTISDNAIRALPGLRDPGFVASELPSRIGFPPPDSSLLLPQQTTMEHDLFQDRPSQSSDQPPAAGIHGSSSDHMGTATLNDNLTASSPSTDPSRPSYSPVVVPGGRPDRLGTSVSNYRPMYRQHPHATPQQSTLSPTSTAYHTAQQTQPQNSGGQPQQQHYMSQPMSPTIYYPAFSHIHQQGGSPNAYNVNQGYMGPVSTSAGPSMPVATYAYSHPYAAHVSDHPLHPFAYPGPVGGMSTGSLPVYPELDPQAHQQMQNRSGNVDMMAGYVPIMTTTAPPFAYSIPAYAPTGGSIFTPQYTGGHPYGYAPPQTQPFPAAYGQTHQGPRSPPLNLSQQRAPIQGSSQVGLDLPPGPPSPLMFPNTNQGTSSGYSPIVSPAPGSNPPRRLDFVGRRASGSSSFSLGLNPGANSSFPAFGSNSAVSSGDIFGLDRTGRVVDSTCSTNPVAVDLVGPGSDGNGAQTQELSSSQQDQEPATHGIATPNQQDRPDQQQTSTKGERSDWVMWVGNVPGDADLNELYSFFGQGPPIPEEERTVVRGNDLAGSETLPQVEGAALEPTTRDETDVADIGVGVGGLSGVVSVFLISRSNCAFVNYVSEASLQRGVDHFNGRPLRNPQVDPRCPKLVCRVRKKGDDIKAGVGGQRGVGTHTRWVKEHKAGEAANLSTMTPTEGDDGPKERPPFVHGGPAGNAKKTSSGSSGSYASTTSTMLMKHFPSRYFILKSLTQHDLDLSVERGLWATQVHNQEVLDQAYRTSQNVYLIFGVNKSGEFFGYAKMDGPINQVERTPSIEWASRDSLVSPGSAKSPAAAAPGAPFQPTIREEKERGDPEQEEQQGLDLAPPPTEDKRPSVHSSNDATTARGDEQRQDLPRSSSVPSNTSDPAKHENLHHHQASEPIRPRQPEVDEGPPYERFARSLRPMSPRSPEQPKSVVSPTGRIHPSMVHLIPGAKLQDSPDPLTPGEDQKLHSLGNSVSSGQSKEYERDSSGFSIASAPAIMGRGYKRLSAPSPAVPSETWDETRKGAIMWTKEHSIEEEFEGGEDIVEPPSKSQSLPAPIALAPVEEAEQPNQPPRLEISATPLALPHLDTPDIHPAQPEPDTAEGATTRQPEDQKLASDAPAIVGGREEGWGTPFKVKWLRTDPLTFHRTRHLRNPWNHDREIKVSRDGTEIEPGVGQRLLEEWERTETGPMAARAPLSPRGPISLGTPPSPTQAFIPRGRGRGRGAMIGGWVQRDTGQ